MSVSSSTVDVMFSWDSEAGGCSSRGGAGGIAA